MILIIKFIFQNNAGFNKIRYLIKGAIYQIFKRTFNAVISHPLFNGKKIFLFPHCNVSTMFMYTELPDSKEIFLLRSLAKQSPNSYFIDVGANIGSYSVCMMDVCEKIIAFEPHPYTSKRCKMNFLLNGKDESSVKQLALSNESGQVRFTDYGHSSTINKISSDAKDSQNSILVDTLTFDDFSINSGLPQDCSYILKVDVEGHELPFFEGSKKFFNQYSVKGILFECFETQKVFNCLKGYGFLNIIKVSENNYFATKG